MRLKHPINNGLPNFLFEEQCWQQGCQLVIGVDEVGRGALAGSVVAGAVAIGSGSFLPCSAASANVGVRLRAEKRSLAKIDWENLGIDDSKRLTAKKREALGKLIRKNAIWGIGEVGVCLKNQKAIIKGDQKVISIAAASVIAKVYRDKMMTGLERFNKGNRYGWKQNKDYGTRGYQEAIKRYGLTKLHRLAFVKKFI